MKGVQNMNRFFLVVFVLLSSLLCADDSKPADNTHLDKVSVQFMWLHQFQFAGYYVAKEKGYYKSFGLDVELKEFKYGMNVTDEVVDGKSDFGVGRSSLIIDRIQKKPVVLLSAIFQKSPHILLSKKSSRINKISDLKGKRVMVTGDLVTSASIVVMLSNQGLSMQDIIKQEHTFDLNDLIEGNTDTMGAYVSNEPYQLKLKGIETQVFDPADYGFDLYSDIMFTSKEAVRKDPERAEAFRKATLKGWEYAFSNIEETAKLINEKYNTQNKSLDALIYEGRVLKEYAYVNGVKLGDININKVQRIVDLYFILGLVTKGIVLDDILYQKQASADRALFTHRELQWLKEHPVIKVGAHENYPPFEYVQEMEHKGILPAYFDILQKRIGVKFQVGKSYSWSDVMSKVRSGELDMLGLAVSTENKLDYLNFTRPYLSFPVAIITKDNVSYLHDHRQLRGKKLVVAEGSATYELLAQEHPEMELTIVSTIDKALEMVSYGEAFAFLGNIATSSYVIKKNGLVNLKVSGDMGSHLKLTMAVRKDWPEFFSILQKAMDSVTENEKDEIYNRWLFLDYDKGIDSELFIKIVGGLIFLLFIPIVWAVLLRKQITKRKIVEKKLQEEVEKTTKLSITDTLTGINNRLHIDQFLEQEIQRSQRYKNDLSIILIDIDDFKDVNDDYGHIVGDEVLVQFVKIISPMIRRTDVFGRWGGEEFLIICTETEAKTAVEIAEGIRAKINAFDFKTIGHKTASIGVAAYVPNDTIVSFISRADTALYKAKESGKNRVINSADIE